jgi:hypothetical protein
VTKRIFAESGLENKSLYSYDVAKAQNIKLVVRWLKPTAMKQIVIIDRTTAHFHQRKIFFERRLN